MKKSIYALAILGLSSLLLAACGGSNSQDADPTTTTAGDQDMIENEPDISEIEDDVEMPIEPLIEDGPELPNEDEPPPPPENEDSQEPPAN